MNTFFKTVNSNKWYTLLLYILLMVSAYFISQYSVAYLFANIVQFVGKESIQSPVSLNAIAGLVSYAIMFGVIFFGLKYTIGFPSRATIGLDRAPKWTDVLIALGVFPVYLITSTIISAVIQSLNIPGYDSEQMQAIAELAPKLPTEYVLLGLLVIVAAAVFEEIFTRGILFGDLRRRGVALWLNILVVSILFAIAHGQWNVIADTFVVSVYLCIVRLMTTSIWSGIFIHMIKNGMAFYILFFVGVDALKSLAG